MDYFRIALYLLFGILPSLAWLWYYLKKDLHPEPKQMIIKIFLLGCLVTVPVYFLQLGTSWVLTELQIAPSLANFAPFFNVLEWFVVIALVEELAIFLVVKLSVFNSSHLDEPVDIMIYMVVAALGFAAVENVIYLFAPLGNLSFIGIIQATITISFLRFIGATLLHTLCSSLLGYYVVLGISRSRRNLLFLLAGLFFAAVFHGLYDFSITFLQSPFNLLMPVVIIVVLSLLMIYNFKKAVTLKSVCKI